LPKERKKKENLAGEKSRIHDNKASSISRGRGGFATFVSDGDRAVGEKHPLRGVEQKKKLKVTAVAAG